MEDYYRHGWGPAATAVASLEGVEGRLALHEAQSVDRAPLSVTEGGRRQMSPCDPATAGCRPPTRAAVQTPRSRGAAGGACPRPARARDRSRPQGRSGRGSPYNQGQCLCLSVRGQGARVVPGQGQVSGSPHSGLSPHGLLRPPAMPRACYSGEQALCASMAQVRSARTPQLPGPEWGSSTMGPGAMEYRPLGLVCPVLVGIGSM